METLLLHKYFGNKTLHPLQNKPLLVNAIALAVSIIPVYYFFRYFFSYSTNIPFGDDYDVLSFYLQFDKLDGIGKLKALFSQHNEHRIFYTRVVVLISAFLQREIDFTTWSFIGNLAVVGLGFVLYACFRYPKYKALFFLPAVWFLFTPFYHNNVFWGMASLQNTTVVFFSLLAIYLAGRPATLHLVLAIAFSVLATYTSGSGMFASFVGVLILLHQRRYKALGVYTAATATAILLYFYQYHTPPHHPSVSKSILEYPDAALASFFAFLGNTMKLTTDAVLFVILVTGLFFFLYILYLFQSRYYEKNPASFGMLLYILMAALSASLARAGFGASSATDSRYAIYSVVLLCLVYLSAVEHSGPKAPKYLFGAALCFSLFFNHKGYEAANGYAGWFRDFLVTNAGEWQAGKPIQNYHDPAGAGRMLNTLISEGRYSGIQPKPDAIVTQFEGGSPLPDGHVAMWANSTITARPIPLPKGKYRLMAEGYSTKVNGVAAHVNLYVNGRLFADAYLDEDFAGKAFIFEAAENTNATFSIQFDNDENAPGEDRNAFIKQIRINRVQ